MWNETTNRWQQITFNKWVIVIEQSHLNYRFIQERNESEQTFKSEFVVSGCLDIYKKKL